ncbi:GNAT family N-acetyltransferase [uncultured Microbacterium sp.]|uniref:GNAT family N-acetyltransferase n=1 Tax=uncultured Microbacterium sp. TaxID=191216 RepID=UPI0035CA1E7E
MVSIQALAVDDPRAHALLAEYFRSRELGFVHQNAVYTATFPDPSIFTPPAGVFVVLVDDDEADVGCGGIRRIADDAGGIRYEVKHLYLRPQTRGRGWGRLLLDDLERRAREWDAAQLVLDTHHSLEAAAGLYRSAGFVETEPFNDNPNATRWYVKRLRSPQEG